MSPKSFKNLGMLFVAAVGVGRHLHQLRAAHRATSVKVRGSNKFTPHQGAREVERRKRQIARGFIRLN